MSQTHTQSHGHDGHGHGHGDGHGHGHGKHEHHVIPISTYLKVFAALLVLTVMTVGVSYHVTGYSLGAGSAAIAMAIASTKAVLVMAFFMHLKFEGKMNRVIFGSAFFFLVVLYFFPAVDIFTRVIEHGPPH